MAKKPAKRPPQAHSAPPAAGNQPPATPRPPNDRGQGQKGFKPTPEQRKIVEAAVGFGVQHTNICQLVINPKTGEPISRYTLHEHFKPQLAKGKAMAHFNVGKSLYEQAVGIPKLDGKGKQTGWISAPDVAATIWFTKSQMGWKDTSRGIDVTVFEAFVRDIGGNVAALRAIRTQLAPPEEPTG